MSFNVCGSRILKSINLLGKKENKKKVQEACYLKVHISTSYTGKNEEKKRNHQCDSVKERKKTIKSEKERKKIKGFM